MTAERPTAEQVYQAWHGTSDPWGGCANSEAVERVMALFGPAQADDQPTTADIVEGEVWAWLNRHDAPWSPSDAKVGDLARAVAAALGAPGPVCAWCEGPASGTSEFKADGLRRPSCVEHGLLGTYVSAERADDAENGLDSTGSAPSTHARLEAAYALRLLGVEPTRARIDHILSGADQTATGWSDLPLRLRVIETLQRWLPDAAATEAWENGLAPLLAPDAETEVFDEVRITYPLGVNGDRHATDRVYAHVEDPVRKLQEATEDYLGCDIKVTKVETRTVTTTRTHWKST